MTYLPNDLRHSPIRQHVNNHGKAKLGWAERTRADERAALLNDMGIGSKRRPYRAYRCEFCGRWHVGRKPTKTARRAA